MARSSRGWIGAGLLAAALGGALWLWREAGAPPPEPRPASRDAGRSAPAVSRAPAPPRWSGSEPLAGATRATPMAPVEGQHLIDPCADVEQVAVPPGHEVAEANGVTVAWPPAAPAVGPMDVPPRPLALAHLVAGLLEEAAGLTGTARRAELTVVVYPSRDAFHSVTKAPQWAGGLYDGAVRVPADPRGDLGVAMSTLRHEVMHAQLHAAAGCMPVWFNEGAAMYFAGAAPVRDWIELLRGQAPLELGLLEAPGLDERATPRVDRVYAQSFAMVLLHVERGGGGGGASLASAVAALAEANRASPREGLALWSRLHPRTDHAAVLDALSRRIFGVPPGELGGMLDGPICCHGILHASELSCRAATPPRPGRVIWTDETTVPRASCRGRW